MRKVITIFVLCWTVAFGATSRGADLLPLTAIDSGWMSKRIPVNNVNGNADVMTLLKAFHAVWPSEAVQAIIDAAGDNSFYEHDESSMPPGCHGIVYMDCEDFNWAYFRHVEGGTQDVEARACLRDNGHTLFVITFAAADDKVRPFWCFYDYDPASRMMTPEKSMFGPYFAQRTWENSTLRYHLGFEYDQTIIVEETSPAGEKWYHHYSFTGMTYVYSHTSSKAFDYADEMDETDEKLPEEAELKDEDNGRELYVNVDGVGSENGQWSVWLRDKDTGIVTYLFATENTAEPRWSQMQDGNGIPVPMDEIAAGNCSNSLFIPWDADKIFVEGCPDERNVWSYIIDINTREAIQLPTNEGLIAIDPGKREIHMSHYLYPPDGGRYSVERVYTLDGKFTGKEYRIPD